MINIFHKKDDTVGITLYRRKNKAIELWYTKPNRVVEKHYHIFIDSKIVHLFGRALFFVDNKSKFLSDFSRFFSFTVPHARTHGLLSYRYGCLFLNIESLEGHSKQSAAQDYHAVS